MAVFAESWKFAIFALLIKITFQMSEIKIAGIMRAGAYSPNHIGNDAAIFNLVADQLRKRGCIVNVYSEEQFASGAVDESIILNMCREERSIELLQQREDRGDLVINSGYGIENCTRERLTRILMGSNIPYPESLIVNTDVAIRDELKRIHFEQCWIKRGERFAMHKEDVSFCRHAEEAQEVLQEYFLRGIKRAVISRHLEGDLVKFYGVAGTSYFYWFKPFYSGNNRHGLGAVNDRPTGIAFDENLLVSICRSAAEALDIQIYGGDCIVSPNGEVRIIDFNDWPSFAPCRNEAAPYIAKCVMNRIREHK